MTCASGSVSDVADRPYRVAIVDDDPNSASLLSHRISLLGHRAAVFAKPEAALAGAGEFDLMLLDLDLQAVDGFALLRRLRDGESAACRPPLPVIAITRFAGESDRLRCLMAGFADLLVKPVHADSLAAAMRRALGRAPGPNTGMPLSGRADSDAERLRASGERLSAQGKPRARGFGPTAIEAIALRSQQLIEALTQSLMQRDAEASVQHAHALRSAAGLLGAKRLADMCQHIERCTLEARWDELDAMLPSLQYEHQVVLSVLFEYGH